MAPIKMDCEVTVRSLGGNKFTLEGAWCDTDKKAWITIGADPRTLSLAALFDLCEKARVAGEEELKKKPC